MDGLDDKLTPAASQLVERLRPRIAERLSEVRKIPVAVLIWGPGEISGHPMASLRMGLRARLRQEGHAALYSEELCDSGSEYSIRLQELAQAQEFDVIVSLPCTPGALAELHDFAADPRIRAKILAFLNEKFAGGYSAQSLQSLSTRLAFPLVYYPDETNTQVVYDVTLTTVQRLRELKYLDGGRGTV